MKLSDYLHSIGAKPSRWAQQHGISPSIISRYLNQKAGLELSTAHRIIKATNGAVSLDDLFCGMTNYKGENPPDNQKITTTISNT